ncbi:BrnT family toxin [Leptothrix discophora]|uniref:BrnT family toxin n=1 Tax=Leptothrix discophora TaxID=89 RepID=A0ABT9FY77_LEPDI|nr:BrnT family toxin [Leptothrix discophora]MDP4299188.1 BrnT family toxin [Leptothrix discophora]
MQIEFDPNKDETNRFKHGISLDQAAALDWGRGRYWFDPRWAHLEPRVVGHVSLSGRLHVVVFVDRDESRRIISLRKANEREVKRHDEEEGRR